MALPILVPTLYSQVSAPSYLPPPRRHRKTKRNTRKILELLGSFSDPRPTSGYQNVGNMLPPEGHAHRKSKDELS